MAPELHIAILAAGKGTRMRSAHPKVLHKVAGVPMIAYVLDAAALLDPASTTLVVGHQAEVLKDALLGRSYLTFVVQEPQRGTAHALLAAESVLGSRTGTLLLLSGDVPLLSAKTLLALLDRHLTARAAATVLTAVVGDPRGYGRIVRIGDEIARIVEDRDATTLERGIREVNSGIYAFALQGLFDAVRNVAATNTQNEYYLPDLVATYRAQHRRVETVMVSNPDEIRGINTRADLAEVGRLVRQATLERLMAAGVTIEDPATTFIDRDVQIGPDSIIHPMVFVEGHTRIGAGCEIHSGSRIVDARLGDGVTVNNHSVVVQADIGDGATVGPFARLRAETTIGAGAHVGNFVEMKKAVLGAGSKAMHLSYLGDTVVGEQVNIGAGTITCNYDGSTKHRTTIEDGAFIGSDSQLIAPVTVGEGAYVGTGTTVREDVPPGALAVSAGKQRNIEGWVERKGKRRNPKRKTT